MKTVSTAARRFRPTTTALLTLVLICSCADPNAVDSEGPAGKLRLCQRDRDCRSDEHCVPLTGERGACTPNALRTPAIDPGPRGQPAPPPLVWAGPHALRPRRTTEKLQEIGQATFAATVSGPLQEVWAVASGGVVEGTAVGDLDGDNQTEIATLVRMADDASGQIRVFAADGTERWTYQAPAGLAGALTFADIDGDSRDEIAFCELSTSGMCRVLDRNGAEVYSFGPFYVPGMAGAGPAAVDVNGDGGEDLIVATYGGLVVAVDGRSGTELWRFDAWTGGTPPYEEKFHGHPAVDDIDGDGVMEVVLGGSFWGSLFVLDASSGAEELVLRDLWTAEKNYFFGNGVALVDLDNNSDTLEIVVSMIGEPHAVMAYDVQGTQLWRVPLPDADFAWLTPVATDVDNDNDFEIFAQSRDGQLWMFDHTGVQLGHVALGSATWSSPSFVNADGDFDGDVIATTSEAIVLLDGRDLTEIGRYAADAGEDGLSPSTLAFDVDRNGNADLIGASRTSGDLIRLALPTRSSTDWYSSLGGGRAHVHRAPGGCSIGSTTPSPAGIGLTLLLLLLLRTGRRRTR